MRSFSTCSNRTGTALPLAGLFLAVVVAEARGVNIADVKLTADNIPTGWLLVKEVATDRYRLGVYGDKLGGDIKEALNQTFAAPKGLVQINYLMAASERDMLSLYPNLIRLGAGENVVAEKDGVIIELVAAEAGLMASGFEALGFGRGQRAKLKPFELPTGWTLSEESLASEEKRKETSRRLRIPVAACLSQSLQVTGQRVKVDYFEPAPSENVTRLNEALAKGKDTTVAIVSGVVCQVKEAPRDTREKVAELLRQRAATLPPSK